MSAGAISPDDLLPCGPARHGRAGSAPPAARAFVPRVVLAVSVLVLGVVLVVNERTVRTGEAILGAHLIQFVFADQAVAATTRGDPSVAFATGPDWAALRVTAECAIALYLGPLLAFAAIFVGLPSISLTRVAWAVAVSAAALVLLNQVRLIGLGFVFSHWGRDAFDWAHSLAGSFLMIFGIAGCLALFFFAVIRPSRRARPGHPTRER